MGTFQNQEWKTNHAWDGFAAPLFFQSRITEKKTISQDFFQNQGTISQAASKLEMKTPDREAGTVAKITKKKRRQIQQPVSECISQCSGLRRGS